MNASFMVKSLPEIRFGAGRIGELPDILSKLGKRTLLLTGAGSFLATDHWHELTNKLRSKKIEFFVEHIQGEPSPEIVDTIVHKYLSCSINAVAAIGGGSVLDAGKSISAMLPGGESVLSFLEGVGDRVPDGRKVPFVAVPTTSGTGSEATSNAVISHVGRDGFKKSLRHNNYVPDIALIDPALTITCPQNVTANCSMDAFSQLVESYLSSKASPFTDDLALGAICRLKKSLFRVCRDGGNLEDRSNMSYGALISGITLSHAGLGIIHGFASVIGGYFKVPHGVVCGTLMAAGNEVTLKKLRQQNSNILALDKYSRLGRIFSDRDKESHEYYQDSFIDMLKNLSSELNLNMLSEYGLRIADVSDIAAKSSCKNNPVELDHEEKQAMLAGRIDVLPK